MRIPDGHATAERRSLAYHRAVAERLDEGTRRRARRTLDRWTREGRLAPAYAARWSALLDLPLDELAGAMTADDEQARDLRQCSPFAGVLPAAERWAILRTVR